MRPPPAQPLNYDDGGRGREYVPVWPAKTTQATDAGRPRTGTYAVG